MKTIGIFLSVLMFCVIGTAAFGQEARVLETIGTVELKAPGSAGWAAARPGDLLTADTIIATGFKSTARLRLGNSLLLIRPLTHLTLKELSRTSGNERVNLELRTGQVRADVRPAELNKMDFTVRSPSVTASVRGTVFEFDTLNLKVAEGLVRFSTVDNVNRTVEVRAGDFSYADAASGGAADPWDLRMAELAPELPVGAATVLNNLQSSGTGIAVDIEWLND
jgi:hypothetical protein